MIFKVFIEIVQASTGPLSLPNSSKDFTRRHPTCISCDYGENVGEITDVSKDFLRMNGNRNGGPWEVGLHSLTLRKGPEKVGAS